MYRPTSQCLITNPFHVLFCLDLMTQEQFENTVTYYALLKKIIYYNNNFIYKRWGLSHGDYFSPHMISQNKNVRQQVWHLEGSELVLLLHRGRYKLSCKSSVVQIGCDSTWTKFTHGEVGGIIRIPLWLWTLWGIILKVYEHVRVLYFKNYLYVL